MKYFLSFLYIHIFCCLFVSNLYCQEIFSYLVQDRLGVILGGTASETESSTATEIVRGMMEQPSNPLIVDLEASREGGFQLSTEGILIPLGNASLPSVFWTPPISRCTAFEVSHDGDGIWIASGDLVILRGKPQALVLPPTLGQGRMVMDLEFNSNQNHLAILFADGGLSLSYPDRFETISAAYLEDDVAIDVELDGNSFLILTLSGKVFRLSEQGSSLVPNLPELGKGLARDMEISPWGEGFYILDAFGVIHHCNGAPEIESTPLQQDAAVDLEFLPQKTPPNWFPPGWNTSASLLPSEMRLDPIGSAKMVSLRLDNAENVSGFVAELSYDPKLVRVDANQVKVGQWWEKKIPSAMVQANIDLNRGKINLFGGGSLLPNTGASGGGEIAKIAIMAVTNINMATTTLELTDFYFRDGYLGTQYQSAKEIRSASIFIQPIEPQVNLVWHDQEGIADEVDLAVGDVVRADIMVENGSRIHKVVFDLLFDNNTLQYLGISLGNGWKSETYIEPEFSIPSKANENGLLLNQTITALGQPPFKDEKSVMLAIFFTVKSSGEGEIFLKNLLLNDEMRRSLNINMMNNMLKYKSQ